MALDLYEMTNDAEVLVRYLPLATLAAEFFMLHFTNRSQDGKYQFWPVSKKEASGYDLNCTSNETASGSGWRDVVVRCAVHSNELPNQRYGNVRRNPLSYMETFEALSCVCFF